MSNSLRPIVIYQAVA